MGYVFLVYLPKSFIDEYNFAQTITSCHDLHLLRIWHVLAVILFNISFSYAILFNIHHNLANKSLLLFYSI